MANTAITYYYITGEATAVKKLYDAICLISRPVWGAELPELAKKLGMNTKADMRGTIYSEDYDEYNNVLWFLTESKWTACTKFFDELNQLFNDELSISYREVEPGNGIYVIHDEDNFFQFDCHIECGGKMFEDNGLEEDMWAEDAINKWCEIMSYPREDISVDDMLKIINETEFDDEDTYFFIGLYERI